MKLLVVEDEVKTANSLKKGLEEKGYEVVLAHDGETAFELTQKKVFDLIVMDIIMPKINGLDLCKKLRGVGIQTPVIMLTALSLTSDKIKGFDSGTDDYLVKPFDFEELLARIRVAISRTQNKILTGNQLEYSDLILNLDTKEVSRGGVQVNLTAKEYALLEFFMRNKNKVISKEAIAEKVWDINFDTGTNIIEVYVSYLRNKIDNGFDKKLIHTKKGMGYIFRDDN